MRNHICHNSIVKAAGIFLLLLLVASEIYAQVPSVTDGIPCTDPKTLSGQDLLMFGRLLSAVEDLGGGYSGEARGKYERIVHDLGKGQYSACLRWMAYDGYGQSLIAAHKKQKAMTALAQAIDEAKALGDAQRLASQRHLQFAEQMK